MNRVQIDTRYVPAYFQDIMDEQWAFSTETFGPRIENGTAEQNAAGCIDHIREEIEEVAADPSDIMEWVDIVMLATDGAMRVGFTPEQFIDAYYEKLQINKARDWPDWRTAEPGKAIKHVKTFECPINNPDCEKNCGNYGCGN